MIVKSCAICSLLIMVTTFLFFCAICIMDFLTFYYNTVYHYTKGLFLRFAIYYTLMSCIKNCVALYPYISDDIALICLKIATRPDGDLAVYFPQRNWETML